MLRSIHAIPDYVYLNAQLDDALRLIAQINQLAAEINESYASTKGHETFKIDDDGFVDVTDDAEYRQ